MKILYVTTIGPTMTFFTDLFGTLKNNDVEVELACSLSRPVDSEILDMGIKVHEISFSRNPLSKDNLISYKQLQKVVEKGNYDIVHCHTPNASVITRLVCRKFRKKGLKVLYTAHGFHFYKGAPMLNWLIYYPIEKICSYFTDKLITINKEDYQLAKRKMKAKEVCYVPGVGIDTSKFKNVKVDKNAKRREIGVPEDCFLLLSVGELNDNKNHQIVIKALEKLHNPKVHYAIAGQGEKENFLLNLANELGVSEQVHLLGYRNDVAELYRSSDIYVLPSIREGLNVSLMEAMASGVPAICTEIRGNVDLINSKGGFLFSADNVEECEQSIVKMMNSDLNDMGKNNMDNIIRFSNNNVLNKMRRIYGCK